MKALKQILVTLCCLVSGIAAAQNTPQTKLEFKNLHDMPYRLVWPATVTDGRFIYAINGFVPSGGLITNFMYLAAPLNSTTK